MKALGVCLSYTIRLYKMAKSMRKSSMKKSMKKAAKSGMKRRKAMKVSKIAKGKRAKSSVFRGTKVSTSGGLKKADLTKNKNGKVVSRKRSELGKRNFKKNGLDKWFNAVKGARKALGVKGFCPVGGKSTRGQALLKKTRSLYK